MSGLKIERIEERLAVLGLTARAVSIQVTGKPGFIQNIRNGAQTSTSHERAERLAAALQCSVAYLYGESDELGEPPAVHLPTLPTPAGRKRQAQRELRVIEGALLSVRFAVQAGAWIEVDEAAQVSPRGAPVAADARFPKGYQWLELVRGDSMDLIFPEGAWVHAVDAVEIGYAPRQGDLVVVERRRQGGALVERSLKQIVITAAGAPEFWPRSHNAKWRSPLTMDGVSDDVDGEHIRIAALVIGGYRPTA